MTQISHESIERLAVIKQALEKENLTKVRIVVKWNSNKKPVYITVGYYDCTDNPGELIMFRPLSNSIDASIRMLKAYYNLESVRVKSIKVVLRSACDMIRELLAKVHLNGEQCESYLKEVEYFEEHINNY